jgi:hypothetical protein
LHTREIKVHFKADLHAVNLEFDVTTSVKWQRDGGNWLLLFCSTYRFPLEMVSADIKQNAPPERSVNFPKAGDRTLGCSLTPAASNCPRGVSALGKNVGWTI